MTNVFVDVLLTHSNSGSCGGSKAFFIFWRLLVPNNSGGTLRSTRFLLTQRLPQNLPFLGSEFRSGMWQSYRCANLHIYPLTPAGGKVQICTLATEAAAEKAGVGIVTMQHAMAVDRRGAPELVEAVSAGTSTC